MAISIKDPETDRLARALADATGETLTEAIRRALEERLARERRSRSPYRLERAERGIASSRQNGHFYMTSQWSVPQ